MFCYWFFRNKIIALWQGLRQRISTQLQRLQQWISTQLQRRGRQIILVLFVIILAVLAGQIIWYNIAAGSKESSDSNKFTILVADFDGKKDYKIRDSLITQLNTIENRYTDTLVIKVLPQGEVVTATKHNDLKIKYQDRGNFLIWAFYSEPIGNFFTLEHHFEPVSQTKVISEEGLFRERTFLLSSPTEFAKEKTYFINEIVYLSLFTLGMNYYEEGESETIDMKKRIKQFSSASELLDDASNQKLSPEPALDKRLVLCYKGVAYYKQGRLKESQDILKQAQETLKQASLDGSGIKFPEGCPHGTKDVLSIAPMATSPGGGGGGGGGFLMVK